MSKTFCLFAGILCVHLSSLLFASPVTSDEAAEAVGTWVGMRAQLGCRLGRAVAGARTCSPTNGVSFHVVKLAGGGFVVTSSDTETEPILAFSESDDLTESEDNPLWTMLRRDLAPEGTKLRQVHGLASAAAASSAAASSSTASTSAAAAKWARLLPVKATNGLLRTLHAATGLETLSDIRVAPLLRTMWSQRQDAYYSNMGDPCYNSCTPNNYSCGCVATAGAQIMRYHRHPTVSVTPGAYACRVKGVSRKLKMQGGVYDWDAMPYVPADGTTLAERLAIGKLTYDVGVTCLSEYDENGTYAACYMLARCLPLRFGYAEALAACGDSLALSVVRKTLISNLDAKLPVVVGIGGGSGGHAVVADGYGYSLSTFYVHFNMGWAGMDDAWYAPPNVRNCTAVDTLVYNIHPTGVADGVICSGRVLALDGSPVTGATVRVSGAATQTATTDANGIYAFILAPGSYTVSSGTALRSVTLKANVGSDITSDGYYYEDPAPVVNNVCDLDLMMVATSTVSVVQIAFDANGGKVSPSSKVCAVGGTYSGLPVPTRAAYVFSGWYTAKTGGDLVQEGDTVDPSVLDAKKPTLYAHWQKAYVLTLKGANVEAVCDGTVHAKSVSVLSGKEVVLRASETYTDAKGVSYLFQRWTPSKAYDFGEGYSASSCETTIEMPASALTMTATYVKEAEAAWMTMYAYGEPVCAGDFTIEADTSKFLWSVDGKAWFPSGTTALVKKGAYSVQWKSLDDVWTAPTAKTKVTVAAGESYDNGENPAEFTFVYVADVTAVVSVNGEQSESKAGGTATVSPADGRLVSGKTLTLTAKAAKGYAFTGWRLEGGSGSLHMSGSPLKLTSSETGYMCEYLDGEDHRLHFRAVFRPVSDYRQEDMARAIASVYVGSREISPEYDEDYSGKVEFRAGLGCATYIYLGCSLDPEPLAYKVQGTLPKGLKFDATCGGIYGTPTATGTSTFTVVATDPAGHACSLEVTLVVRSVFTPVVGDWRALLTDDSGACAGLFEMSVTDRGKASGKIITAAGTVSVTPTVSWTEDEDDPDGDGTFEIYYEKSTGNGTSGSYVSLSVDPTEGFVAYETSTWKNGAQTGYSSLSGELVKVASSWFKDEAFAASFLGKYYTLALEAGEASTEDGESGATACRTPSELLAPGYLTVTTDKKGAVKVAGKLSDGEKISASAVLLPHTDGSMASAMLFVVPSGYKKKGAVALRLEFSPVAVDAETLGVAGGEVVSSVGEWTTPPLLDAISGWESEDEVFLPGKLSLSAGGAVYSKLDDLTNYYLSLAVSTSAATPTLEYTYTDAEKTKCYGLAEPTLCVYSLGSEMLKGGKGGKITVGKSAAPWKDSAGCYHYDETKADKSGQTQTITNPGGLTISYKSATGVFSGKFNLYFDYEVPQYKNGEEIDPKRVHKSVSCSCEGVLVNGGGMTYGVGSAQYSGKYTYGYYTVDKKGNEKSATKTYTQKFALPVSWSLGAPDL